MSSLRTDERSWLIYDDESIGAVTRAMEMYALSVTGQKLARHPDQRVRAIGHTMLRIGEHRGWEMMQNDGAQRIAVEHFAMLGAVLNGRVPYDPVKAEEALDELHATVFHMEGRANRAGVRGPGVVRQAVRGD